VSKEPIAYGMGFINEEQLMQPDSALSNSRYGVYLKKFAGKV